MCKAHSRKLLKVPTRFTWMTKLKAARIQRAVSAHRAGGGADAGTIDIDVDRAEACHHAVDRGFHGGGIRDIGRESGCIVAQFARGLVGEVGIEVQDRDLAAGLDHGLRSGPAEARCAAGNDGDSIFDLHEFGPCAIGGKRAAKRLARPV